MAIHNKEEASPNLNEKIFGTSFLPHPLHKYQFPKEETAPAAAYQFVHDELLLDGNANPMDDCELVQFVKDNDIDFSGRVGPIEFEQSFSIGDMLFAGKLEL